MIASYPRFFLQKRHSFYCTQVKFHHSQTNLEHSGKIHDVYVERSAIFLKWNDAHIGFYVWDEINPKNILQPFYNGYGS